MRYGNREAKPTAPVTVHVRQQGRDWRSLADTGAASHVLRGGSRYWSRLRRGQDYYSEGAAFWLEADALIRNLTDGEKSLDNFCQKFFSVLSAIFYSPPPFG